MGMVLLQRNANINNGTPTQKSASQSPNFDFDPASMVEAIMGVA